MLGEADALSALPAPSALTLTNDVRPRIRSRTKTSGAPLESLVTRLPAELIKTTNRPSPVMVGVDESPAPDATVWLASARLTRSGALEAAVTPMAVNRVKPTTSRSEERRVGKECRTGC